MQHIAQCDCTVCLITLFCLHEVTASDDFLKQHTHLLYTQKCICLLHTVTGTEWHNAVPYHSHASCISSNSDSNSKSSDSSLSRNGTSNGDEAAKVSSEVAVCTSQCNKEIEVWSLSLA